MKRPDDFESRGNGNSDSIAIIGMGCRFPGGSDNPNAFWDMMAAGKDGIVEVPVDRWDIDRFWDPDPEKPGKMYIKAGGFIRQSINEFDAFFFGMSPREAEYLDPQQRVLLEVTWEAFEDAGLNADKLAGSDTGVYVGGFMFDNMLTQLSPLNRALIGTHTAVSSTLSILANRLSYVFDLRGPNIAMDTACSSSLVALHQACQALLRGECSMAVAGGVNIMYRPENPISMCKGGFLAKDGRCKSFDARADGYGRGEGAGIVVLKPLSQALRDQDNIYALIRGTGVNQDGRTNGITVPNPEAQESLVRQVCRDAGIKSGDIRYFEAHGTGTPVGDPLEVRALGAVIGSERDADNPCIVGSVKANIGHLEAASGVAGVIKAALCLRHKQIPPLANLETPNPDIPFEELGMRLPKGLEPMPPGDGPALVGVNSFGYGGTNAHAILEEWPVETRSAVSDSDDRGYWLLPLSARAPQALQELACAYRQMIVDNEGLSLHDLCYSAGVRRSHHDHRCGVVADSRDALLERLEAVAEGVPAHGVALGGSVAKGRKPVFVFTGMGPQWWAMGRELYETDAVFRHKADEIDRLFQKAAGWSILQEMLAEEGDSHMAETRIAQPANFVIQVALAAMWQARGIEPSAVVGHSVGEVAAAYVAGVYSLEEAVKVSYERSRIQQKAAGLGAMLAVGLGESDAVKVLMEQGGKVSIAAANSPTATTLAGDKEALESIAAQLESQGVFNRFLRVEMAFHSPYMDHLRPELMDALPGIEPKTPQIPLYSTVTGAKVESPIQDADYWCRNVREPVYFAKAVAALLEQGEQVFLEIGPHPVLSTSIKEAARDAGVDGVTVASLRRNEPEKNQFLTALVELYAAGADLDWRRQYQNGGHYIPLPTYPWQRETYWHESMASLSDRMGSGTHPLLGFKMDGPEANWSQALNQNYQPYLQDHQVDDVVVLPGAAYVELGFAVRAEAGLGATGAVEDLRFSKALVIGSREEPEIRTLYQPEGHQYRVYSRSDTDNPWALHASGRLSELPLKEQPVLDLDAIKTRNTQSHDGEQHYHNMDARGLHYGPWFQGVKALWQDGDQREVLARIERKEPIKDNGMKEICDPTLLDACFQTLLALLDESDRRVYVPVAIRRVALWQSLGEHIWCYGRRTGGDDDTVLGDIHLCDEAGNVLAEVIGVRAQALNRAENGVDNNLDNWFYEYGWTESVVEEAPAMPAGRWLLLLDNLGVGAGAADVMQAGNADVIRVARGDRFAVLDDGGYQVAASERSDIVRLLQSVDAGSLNGIVSFWGLDSDQANDPVGIETVAEALTLVQALGESQTPPAGALTFVTCGAQSVRDEVETELAETALAGLMRVAVNEYPEQAFRAIDLDPAAEGPADLFYELGIGDGEEEIAYRGGCRFVRRLTQLKGEELKAAEQSGLSSPDAVLPAADEVSVEIQGCSMAFADAKRYVQVSAPGECFATGVVTATGSAVMDVSVGDPALIVYHGEPARSVTLPASKVIPLASTSDLDVFASQAESFVTAHYSLHHLARLSAGERILIHQAGTTLGLAAIRVALNLGAEVYATVGEQGRVDLVRSLGVQNVVDGRSADFAEQLLDVIGERGIDVAFGIFEGEYAAKTAEVLAPLGRMIAVSHDAADFHALQHPGLANRALFRLCPAQLRTERPDVFLDVIKAVQTRLSNHVYKPVPIQFQDLAAVTNDEHAIVETAGERVSVPVDENLAERVVTGRAPSSTLPLRDDGTYMITGGFGGFGMELARWLAKQGVRNLVLVGRRGAVSEDAKALVKMLEKAGVNVLAAAADMSKEAEVVALLTQTAASMPPLRGVFHTAAVLDDSSIKTSDPSRFAAVMRPKALGAWYLHRHTQHLPIEVFVLFSSISALIGNPGQGAYVAANAVLDTLAHQRQAQGLSAVSINWGALSEVGMVAQDSSVEEYFKRVGIGFLNPAQALEVLGKSLLWGKPQLGAALIDCQQWAQFNPAWAASPRYRHLIADASRGGEGGETNAFLAALSELAEDEHQSYAAGALIGLISDIMRIPADKIDKRQSLVNLGVDSLMAMELQAAIGRLTGVKLSTLELMKGNAIEQLAAQVLTASQAAGPSDIEEQRLPPSSSKPESTPEAAEDVDAVLARLDDLSEEEIDKMLATLTQS